MPFEIAPKEVSVADKLAALIETGHAANPHLKHIRKHWKTTEGVCAMSFAYIAAGIPLEVKGDGVTALAEAVGCEESEIRSLMRAVIGVNDTTTKSIPQIVEALRAGEVKPDACMQYIDFGPSAWIKTYAKVIADVNSNYMKIVVENFYGDADKFDPIVFAPKAMETVELPHKAPAAKIRKSAKTGKCWPVAKHAYA